jgi:hypothetical protein
MSYLRGPLTRAELVQLNQTVAAPTPPAANPADTGSSADSTTVPPQADPSLRVAYLDAAAPWAPSLGAVAGGTRLEAALAFRLSLTYRDAKADLEHTQEWEAVLHPLDEHADPSAAHAVDYDERDLRPEAPADATYVLPAAPIDEGAWIRRLEKELVAEARVDQALELQRNKVLKLYARVGESAADFSARCAAAARDAADAEAAKLSKTLEARIATKRGQVESAQRREESAAADEQTRRSQEVVSGAGALLGVLLGGGSRAGRAARGVGSAASRRSMTQRAAQRRQEAATRADMAEEELADLERQLIEEVDAIYAEWDAKATEIDTVTITPSATNVQVTDRALVWIPT